MLGGRSEGIKGRWYQAAEPGGGDSGLPGYSPRSVAPNHGAGKVVIFPAMTLDPDDLASLAKACARRFRSPDAMRRYADLAGLPKDRTAQGDVEAEWASILGNADAQGSLGPLTAALAKDAPSDETLQALARTLGVLTAPPPRALPVPMLAVGGAGVLLVAGMGWMLLGRGPGGEAAPKPVVTVAAPAAPVAEAAPPPAEAAPPPVEAPAAEAVVAPAAAPPAAKPTRLAGGCTGGAPGVVVGYWYAGREKPGEQGATITLGRDARVRAEYPSAANHHNAAAPERCVLSRGTTVVLHQAPVEASRGYWWVPFVSGG